MHSTTIRQEMCPPLCLNNCQAQRPIGTNDDPDLIAANVRAMNEVCLRLFRAGHLPITGEAMALPLVELAGSQRIGDALFDEIMHPYARALVVRCDACLRIGGLLREQMKWWRWRKRMGEKFIPVLKMCTVWKRKLREHTHRSTRWR